MLQLAYMDKQTVLLNTQNHVRDLFTGEGSGHDWWHIYRVWKMAQHLTAEEKDVDHFVIELAALLHDIADWKFYGGDEDAGPKAAREWLEQQRVDEEVIVHVCEIIKHLSFKGAGVKSQMETKEGMIVQDADKLDAIGAIGIARTFAYGGHANRALYDPDIKPEYHTSFEAYKNNQSHTINHFYEKLLLLKDLMNTQAAKKVAEDRHKYMEEFLNRFYAEWDGKS